MPHALHRNRIHRALSRPSLLLGADRELVLAAGLAAIILIFVVLTPYSIVVGLTIWTTILGLLRHMAKIDPQIRRIYLRHVSYRAVYLATGAPWRSL